MNFHATSALKEGRYIMWALCAITVSLYYWAQPGSQAGIWAMVGWLGDVVGLYFVCLVVWTLWKGNRPRHAERWMRFLKDFRAGWRRTKKPKASGSARYVPVVVAAICALVLIIAASRAHVYQLHDVYVIGYDTDYHYHLRTGTTDFWTTFCRDYEPQFSTGQTLKVLTYEDLGSCWSVAHTHPAYLLLRDEKGVPIIR